MAEAIGPDPDRWAQAIAALPWTQPPDPLWTPGPRHGTWFDSGRINAATACVGVHARGTPDAVAVWWEGEPGDRRALTYAALDEEVGALARALRGLGVESGDVVALHLGWLPETVVAIFACARIGATHAVIPTPLPPEALADRLTTLAPRVLFTQDGAWRHGTVLPLKARADEALSGVGGIEHTVVVRRTGIDVAWFEGDRWYHDLLVGARPGRSREDTGAVPPVDLPARHPFQLVSLAHRHGRPVTVTLGTGPTLVGALVAHRAGLADGAVLWCAGDVSWLGTQVHGIYGPLLAGESAVMYEGTLDEPTHARAWEIMRRYDVTTLLTTPSVLRMLRAWSFEVDRSDLATPVRRVVAFGEPMDPEVREWAGQGIDGRPVSVADGWGQVELGGIVRLDAPVRADAMPELGELIVDAEGRPVPAGVQGQLVLRRPWAGALVGWSGPPASAQSHWALGEDVYATGDLARLDEGGRLEFLGRTDEVVSVSGQLVSLCEVRAILLEHPFVVAADVFERRDQMGARVLAAAVVLDPRAAAMDPAVVAPDLGRCVRETLGGLARPRLWLLVDRFGDELRGDERRRALGGIPVVDAAEPRRVAWAQVLAAAAYAG
jgi:acetyl-CoA synthetase